MPGKGYKPIDPAIREQARAKRKDGQTIESIAANLGVSSGAVSGWCHDIPVRRSQVKKEVPSGQRESKDIMDLTAGAKLDSDTIELANRVRKARLQSELDEIEDRKQQRQEIEDMRLRERRIMLELDATRQGAAKGESAVVGELTELRRELGELRESRHQAEIRQIEDRHSAEMRQLQQVVANMKQTGLTQYDLMSQAMGKVENLAIMAGSKVDGLVANFRSDRQFSLAIELGLSPDELAILKRGLESPMTKGQFELIKQRVGVEPEPGEYEAMVAHTEAHNNRYRELVARVGPTLKRENHPYLGEPPVPGEAEPAILKAETRLVKCQRCGTTFDIDLTSSRQQAVPGKKLFVNCANPKCQFLLDITELLPELAKSSDKSTTPECYVAGQDGRCNSELRGPEQCIDCQWFAVPIKNLVYE